MEKKLHGLFAMGAASRPNPVGFSVVRVEKRKGNILHLAEVEMLEGMPVLDVKPFVPNFDHGEDVWVRWMEGLFLDVKEPPVSDNRS